MKECLLVKILGSEFINRSKFIKKLLRKDIYSNRKETSKENKNGFFFGFYFVFYHPIKIECCEKNRIYKYENICSNRIKISDPRIFFTEINKEKEKIISPMRFHHKNFWHLFVLQGNKIRAQGIEFTISTFRISSGAIVSSEKDHTMVCNLFIFFWYGSFKEF